MKIGIVTFYGLYNFGNRLQNYAVQEFLRKEGFESETIVLVEHILQRTMVHLIKSLMSCANNMKCKRYMRFWKFDKKYINTRYITPANVSKLKSEYLFFAAGSDQIWNPSINQQKDFFFLRFAEKKQRIAMVPSMAVDSMPTNKKNMYIEYLNGFDNLAVREENARRIIRDLTGRNAEVLIDPTMVLDKIQWGRIAANYHEKKENYWLLYFLGECKYINEIKNKAYENKIKIINLTDPSDDYYISGPERFVSLIMNAELVLTDSFHAVAFSINFNVPFYVMKRVTDDGVADGIYSRIDSLINHYYLSHRTEDNLFDAAECDFEKANLVLRHDREKFTAYFRKVINEKNK